MEGKAGGGLGLVPLLERVSVSPIVGISSAEKDGHSDVMERASMCVMSRRLHQQPADVQVTMRSSCSHTLKQGLLFPNPVAKHGLVLWNSKVLASVERL